MKTIAFLLCFLVSGLWSLTARSETVKLAWNPNPETNISHYILSYGKGSRSYSANVHTEGALTTIDVSDLEPATTYFFAVRAVNDKGLQSEPSAEVAYTTQPAAGLPSKLDRGGWTVTASSGDAAAAIDGGEETEWVSTSELAPHWIQVELPRQALVSALMIQHPAARPGHITDYEIQSSLDGEAWVEIAAGAWHPTNPSKYALTDLAVCRYVRLWSTDPLAAITELDLGGDYAPAPPAQMRLTIQRAADFSGAWSDIDHPLVFVEHPQVLVPADARQFFRLKIETTTPTP